MKKWLMIIAIVFTITLLEIYSVSVAKEEEYKINNEIIIDDFENNEKCILSQDEKVFLNLINRKRKKNNLNEFKITEEFQNIARLKCNDLVENKYFSHISPKYGTLDKMLKMFNISYNSVSENIAKSSNVKSAIKLFMNSENHCKNILSSKYQYTGIAVQNKFDGSKIFVEIFIEKQ